MKSCEYPLNIHEYQARNLLEKHNIKFPKGKVGSTPEEIYNIAKSFGGKVVVKAQIHSGGRGKAGGVKICNSASEAKEFSKKIINTRLITNQTGPEGYLVEKMFVTEITDIKKELYLSLLIDPDIECPVFIASLYGGMDIEKTVESNQANIVKMDCDPLLGIKPYKLKQFVSKLNLPEGDNSQIVSLLNNIYKAFINNDCSLIEINPLVIDDNENLVPLDCKITIDDDALFRNKEILKLRDINQENIMETRAKDYDLAYVKLTGGTVGCMVNGAGLAMATMDITTKSGCYPANFLDVGGSTDKEKIKEAFRILVSDKDVKYILINLFAGIAKADLIAEGIVEANNELNNKLPIIVSMRGTNSESGFEILKNSNINLLVANDLGDVSKLLLELEKTK
ncbi:MAG: ADP-forming succinate--CoA ligase subunit beta [Chloroflexi bacterium]|nr:ADP-forming succinate--CoA ligase subunit beta [Chloroflexota bacterium]